MEPTTKNFGNKLSDLIEWCVYLPHVKLNTEKRRHGHQQFNSMDILVVQHSANQPLMFAASLVRDFFQVGKIFREFATLRAQLMPYLFLFRKKKFLIVQIELIFV